MDIPWSRWACRLLGCWKDWSHRLVTSSLEVKENFQFTRDAPKREDGLSKCPPHVWRVSRRLKRNSFRSYKLLTVSQVSSNFSLWCFIQVNNSSHLIWSSLGQRNPMGGTWKRLETLGTFNSSAMVRIPSDDAGMMGLLTWLVSWSNLYHQHVSNDVGWYLVFV